MQIAIYTRVSTFDQSSEMQKNELFTYMDRMKWSLYHLYDETISGSSRKRPEFDRLMEDAKQKRFDCVIVWKMDRWGRSVSTAISSIQELSRLGIRWISTTQGIDTDVRNPMANFFMTILAAVAEFEKDMINERTALGRKNAMAKGIKFGRPQKQFNRHYAQVLRSEGKSWSQIAKILEIPATTIRDSMK